MWHRMDAAKRSSPAHTDTQSRLPTSPGDVKSPLDSVPDGSKDESREMRELLATKRAVIM